MTAAYGYDGIEISAGARVELHPGEDLWMRGARFAEVVSASPRYVRVKIDRTGRLLTRPPERFRKV